MVVGPQDGRCPGPHTPVLDLHNLEGSSRMPIVTYYLGNHRQMRSISRYLVGSRSLLMYAHRNKAKGATGPLSMCQDVVQSSADGTLCGDTTPPSYYWCSSGSTRLPLTYGNRHLPCRAGLTELIRDASLAKCSSGSPYCPARATLTSLSSSTNRICWELCRCQAVNRTALILRVASMRGCLELAQSRSRGWPERVVTQQHQPPIHTTGYYRY